MDYASVLTASKQTNSRIYLRLRLFVNEKKEGKLL